MFVRATLVFALAAFCTLSCSKRDGTLTKTQPEPTPLTPLAPSALPGAPFALVELFTSEGCSSCPPADANLSRIDDRAAREERRVFALSFHVDYWNYLGWTDPFSTRAFSERQQAHARALGASTYTPQMVINGAVELLGSARGGADDAIEKALERPAATLLALERSFDLESRELSVKWRVDPAPAHSRLSFAVVQSAAGVHVTRGENRGETLAHRNVVRVFDSIALSESSGVWKKTLAPEIAPDRAELVAFVENDGSLRVLAAERVKLSG